MDLLSRLLLYAYHKKASHSLNLVVLVQIIEPGAMMYPANWLVTRAHHTT